MSDNEGLVRGAPPDSGQGSPAYVLQGQPSYPQQHQTNVPNPSQHQGSPMANQQQTNFPQPQQMVPIQPQPHMQPNPGMQPHMQSNTGMQPHMQPNSGFAQGQGMQMMGRGMPMYAPQPQYVQSNVLIPQQVSPVKSGGINEAQLRSYINDWKTMTYARESQNITEKAVLFVERQIQEALNSGRLQINQQRANDVWHSPETRTIGFMRALHSEADIAILIKRDFPQAIPKKIMQKIKKENVREYEDWAGRLKIREEELKYVSFNKPGGKQHQGSNKVSYSQITYKIGGFGGGKKKKTCA